MGTESIEVGDGVGDDGAIAAIAGFRDDPALLEQCFVGEVLRKKVGGERAVSLAETMGEKQDALVPVDRTGEGELRAIDLAGFERDGGRGEKPGAECAKLDDKRSE